MTQIRLYNNPACVSCARHARVHKFFDWFHKVVISTSTPPGGPLAVGETVVQDLDSGQLIHGAAALDCLCRHIPLYLPMRLLLLIPAVWRKADKAMAGRDGLPKEQRRPITRRWR
jgi:hypothetical protein